MTRYEKAETFEVINLLNNISIVSERLADNLTRKAVADMKSTAKSKIAESKKRRRIIYGNLI